MLRRHWRLGLLLAGLAVGAMVVWAIQRQRAATIIEEIATKANTLEVVVRHRLPNQQVGNYKERRFAFDLRASDEQLLQALRLAMQGEPPATAGVDSTPEQVVALIEILFPPRTASTPINTSKLGDGTVHITSRIKLNEIEIVRTLRDGGVSHRLRWHEPPSTTAPTAEERILVEDTTNVAAFHAQMCKQLVTAIRENEQLVGTLQGQLRSPEDSVTR